MDEENSRELTEAIERLAESVNALTYNLSGSTEAIERETKARKDDTTALGEGAQARRKLTKEEIEAIGHLKRAFGSATDGLKDFAGAVTNTSDGFSKYDKSLGGLGDAAASVARTLPGIGTAAALAIQGLTLFGKTALKQVDNMIKGFNEMAEVGVAGQLGVRAIRDLAAEAGYSTKNMKGFTDAFKSLGPGMIALGGSASDAAKSFGALTKLNKDEIDHYRRLGMSQEQFTQAQADAVKYLTKSGVAIDENMKRDGRLRAATTQYVDSLMQLSALTGESVESMKKQKEQALANIGVQVHLYELNKKETALRAKGDAESVKKADELAAERKRTEELLAVAKGKMSAEQFAGFQKMVTTGQFTKESAAFARSNPEMLEFIKAVKQGREDPAMIAKELQKGQDRMMDIAGTAAKYSDEAAKNLNLSVESMTEATKVRGQSEEQYAKEVAKARERVTMTEEQAAKKISTLEKDLAAEKDPEKRKAIEAEIADLRKGPQTDDILDAQNKRMNLERDLSLALDNAVLAFNPFTSTLGMATVAVGGLAAAAGIAAYAMGKGSALQKGIDTVATSASKAAPALSTVGSTAANVGTKLAGAAGPLAAVGSVAAGAYTGYAGYQAAKEAEEKGEITKEQATVKKSESVGEGVGTAGGGVGGALAGAAAGAAIGSVVPVIGTAIGGILGAAVGGLGGSAIGGYLGKKTGGVVGEQLAKPAVPVARPVSATTATTKPESPIAAPAKTEQESTYEDMRDAQIRAMDSLSKVIGKLTSAVESLTSSFGKAGKQVTDTGNRFKKYDEQLKESLGEDIAKPTELVEELKDGLSSATSSIFSRTGKIMEDAMKKAGIGPITPESAASMAGMSNLPTGTQIPSIDIPAAKGRKQTYTINGKPVTKNQYDKFVAQQNAQYSGMFKSDDQPFTTSRIPNLATPSGSQTIPISTIPEAPLADIQSAPAIAASDPSSGPIPTPKFEQSTPVKAPEAKKKGFFSGLFGKKDKGIAANLPDAAVDQGTKTPSGTPPDAAMAQTAAPAAGAPDAKGPPGGKFKDKEEFVRVMMPWAEYASKALGGASVLGILGQWAGESGTGKNLPADYNYAGIKAGSKFQKGDYVLTEERYNQKQLERAIKSGETLASVLSSPTDTIRKKGRDVTVDEWYGSGAFQKAVDQGLSWVQVKSHFAKFNDLKDFTDGYVSFLKNPRYAEALKAGSAEDFGYSVAKAGYATASADKYASKVGDFASSIQAAAGGIAQGPSTGYPVTMHGKELITPLNPNSLLEKLATTPANDIVREMMSKQEANIVNTQKDESLDAIANINLQMMELMERKFNDLIDKISSGNDIQSRILRQTNA